MWIRDRYNSGGTHIFAGVSIEFDEKIWHNRFIFYNTGINEVSYISAYTLPQLLDKMEKINAKALRLVVVRNYRGNQFIIVDL